MLCALFGAHLLLAIPDAGAKSFHVRAVLDAAHFRVEDADDGQGKSRTQSEKVILLITVRRSMPQCAVLEISLLDVSAHLRTYNVCLLSPRRKAMEDRTGSDIPEL